MHNPFLVGDRVYLRPLEKADAATVAAWFNDAGVNRFTLQYRPMSVAGEEAYLDSLAERLNDLALGVALKSNDQLIGCTGLHQIDWRTRQAGFGILIGVKEQWNQGHGTASTRLMVQHAFHTLNLNRIWLHVYDYNVRGRRAYEKVGFKQEGVLRQDTYRDGRYHDTIVMAILQEEFQPGP